MPDEKPEETTDKQLTPDDWDYYLIPIRNWFKRTFLKKQIAKKEKAEKQIAILERRLEDMKNLYMQRERELHADFMGREATLKSELQSVQNRLRAAQKWEPKANLIRLDKSQEIAIQVKVPKITWDYYDKRTVFKHVMDKIAHEFTYHREF